MAEAHFNVLPETMPLYDHITPASWLLMKQATLAGNAEAVLETLKRAETLFGTLNKL